MGPTVELTRKRCVSCEGGIPPLDLAEVKQLLLQVPSWVTSSDGRLIRRELTARNFAVAIQFFNDVAKLAEDEGHHPDLHLTGYRQVAIELTTHAVGGLTENDFILAAKIDAIPLESKKPKAVIP